MSVQTNQYLIYGAKLEYDKWKHLSDCFEKYEDSAYENDDLNRDGLHCLFDGMSGEYIVIGYCFYKSIVYQSLGDLVIKKLSKSFKKKLKNRLYDEFGITEKTELHLITHYR